MNDHNKDDMSGDFADESPREIFKSFFKDSRYSKSYGMQGLLVTPLSKIYTTMVGGINYLRTVKLDNGIVVQFDFVGGEHLFEKDAEIEKDIDIHIQGQYYVEASGAIVSARIDGIIAPYLTIHMEYWVETIVAVHYNNFKYNNALDFNTGKRRNLLTVTKFFNLSHDGECFLAGTVCTIPRADVFTHSESIPTVVFVSVQLANGDTYDRPKPASSNLNLRTVADWNTLRLAKVLMGNPLLAHGFSSVELGTVTVKTLLDTLERLRCSGAIFTFQDEEGVEGMYRYSPNDQTFNMTSQTAKEYFNTF